MLEKKTLSAKSAPQINLNPEGHIMITGRCVVNGLSNGLYEQIIEWIDEYLNNPSDVTVVDIHLEYFDTFNIKMFCEILKKFEALRLLDKKYIISWFFDEGDEDILEKGESISSAINMPFNFIVLDDPHLSDSDLSKWKTPES